MKLFFKKILDCLVILGLFLVSQLPMLAMSIWLLEQGSLALWQMFSLLILQVLILTIFIIFAKAQGLLDFRWKAWFNLPGLAYSLIGYTMILSTSTIGSLVLYLEGQETTANQEGINSLMGSSSLPLMFMMVVILAPLTEEIICRSLIPRLFSEKYRIWGFVLSTLIFAFLHAPNNIGSFVIYGGMGAILAAIAFTSKRLEYSILAHGLNNLIAFIIMLFLH